MMSVNDILIKPIIYKKTMLFISLLVLNFASGLPFLLILSTLGVRLLEVGFSKTILGFFAWVSIAYGVKFLLAPFLNNIKIPILYALFGQRRSWLLCLQSCLGFALYCLGCIDPVNNLMLTALVAFIIGCLGAMQDVVLEAYRIEILEDSSLGIMASITILGYRLGMLCASVGALYLAHFYSWHVAYSLMACCVFLSMVATFYATNTDLGEVYNYKETLTHFVSATIKHWRLIVGLIVCFKVADTMLAIMSVPYLVDLGFNKLQIANIGNSFGMLAIVVGSFLGGFLIDYFGLQRLFKLCSWLQVIICWLFIMHSLSNTSVWLLYISVGLENFTSGILQVGIIACFSILCIKEKNPLYYAILSSLVSLVRVNSNVLAGFVADHCSWTEFYVLVGCITMANMYWLRNRIHKFLLLNEVKDEYKI